MSTMTLTRPIRPPEPQSPAIPSPGLQSQGLRSPGLQPPGRLSPGFQSPGFQSPGLQSSGLRSHCVRLASGPAAVPAARREVRAAIRAWAVSADPADAALLTSELVTNAVRHAAGPVITLVVSCSCGQVRVDVHDTSDALPEVADLPADAESGRGLHLVASLSDEWGFYRTPAGKAVYFTLASGPDPAPGVGGRHMPGDGEP
jgi:anti-sigma regulatory factor (Ser/Thr protein kinase)